VLQENHWALGPAVAGAGAGAGLVAGCRWFAAVQAVLMSVHAAGCQGAGAVAWRNNMRSGPGDAEDAQDEAICKTAAALVR
jgi:hypothetical protein